MIIINGEEKSHYIGKKLMDHINEQGWSKNRIAVEINEQILPKKEYESYIINDGDKIEIVHFVGGG